MVFFLPNVLVYIYTKKGGKLLYLLLQESNVDTPGLTLKQKCKLPYRNKKEL